MDNRKLLAKAALAGVSLYLLYRVARYIEQYIPSLDGKPRRKFRYLYLSPGAPQLKQVIDMSDEEFALRARECVDFLTSRDCMPQINPDRIRFVTDLKAALEEEHMPKELVVKVKEFLQKKEFESHTKDVRQSVAILKPLLDKYTSPTGEIQGSPRIVNEMVEAILDSHYEHMVERDKVLTTLADMEIGFDKLLASNDRLKDDAQVSMCQVVADAQFKRLLYYGYDNEAFYKPAELPKLQMSFETMLKLKDIMWEVTAIIEIEIKTKGGFLAYQGAPHAKNTNALSVLTDVFFGVVESYILQKKLEARRAELDAGFTEGSSSDIKTLYFLKELTTLPDMFFIRYPYEKLEELRRVDDRKYLEMMAKMPLGS